VLQKRVIEGSDQIDKILKGLTSITSPPSVSHNAAPWDRALAHAYVPLGPQLCERGPIAVEVRLKYGRVTNRFRQLLPIPHHHFDDGCLDLALLQLVLQDLY
jgi:hypothetical protein